MGLSLCLSLCVLLSATDPDPSGETRVWTGAQHWANRLADWRQGEQGLLCVEGRARWPFRSLHRLTRAWEPEQGPGWVSVTLWPLDEGPFRDEQAAGFLIARLRLRMGAPWVQSRVAIKSRGMG